MNVWINTRNLYVNQPMTLWPFTIDYDHIITGASSACLCYCYLLCKVLQAAKLWRFQTLIKVEKEIKLVNQMKISVHLTDWERRKLSHLAQEASIPKSTLATWIKWKKIEWMGKWRERQTNNERQQQRRKMIWTQSPSCLVYPSKNCKHTCKWLGKANELARKVLQKHQ